MTTLGINYLIDIYKLSDLATLVTNKSLNNRHQVKIIYS